MTTVAEGPVRTSTVGALLREWRERRRLSQMELALEAEISTRHLSFLETSRSRPSREMLLRLAEHLDIPLREQNRLLLAAGFAPAYSESRLDAPALSMVKEAADQVIRAHEPNPALAVDRHWNIVASNQGAGALIALVDPALLQLQPNALRIALSPNGLASYLTNYGEWRAQLLGRLRRQVAHSADPILSALLEELAALPGGEARATPHTNDSAVIPMRLQLGDTALAFFSTVSVIGTPLDVTVSELAIESFFPADPATREWVLSSAR